MKILYIIACTLTCYAGSLVFAQSDNRKPKVSSNTENPKSIEITAYENRIRVTNAPIDSILEIYSVVGIKVKEIKIKQSTAEYVVNIAKGYYIIRIGDTVRKVALR